MASLEHRTLSPKACGYCATTEKDKLRLCADCKIIYYCSRDHQVADRKRHKAGCIAVKKARALYKLEDQKLRSQPTNVFDLHSQLQNVQGSGHAFVDVDLGDYKITRFHLVMTMLDRFGAPGGCIVAVQEALDHLLEMNRIFDCDDIPLRDILPTIHLRLNGTQEAYDFVKWWAESLEGPGLEFQNTPNLSQKITDADALEALLELRKGRYMDLAHAVPLFLIKIRAILDLQAIQTTRRALRGTVPQEIIDLIADNLVSNIVKPRPEILWGHADELTWLIGMLKGQVKRLYKIIDGYNIYFWELMLKDPYAAAAKRCPYVSHTKEEACTIIAWNLGSWIETAGAFDMLMAVHRAVGNSSSAA
ncbi:hypothetical protein TWF281_008065 [Arthrobotrys megalospora]